MVFLIVQVGILKWDRANRTIRRAWHTVWFYTIGMCLAHDSNMDTSNRKQFLWIVGLLIFSITSSVILAAVIYENLTVEKWQENIDTLDELVLWNYTVYVVDVQGVGDGLWLTHLK